MTNAPLRTLLLALAWAALLPFAQAVTAGRALPTAAAAADRDTLVIVMRHAEKNTGEDPALSPAGERRAQRLADMLQDAGVGAIYATPYRRTQATAAPLAARVGVPVTSYDPALAAADLVSTVLTAHRGDTVLIVGHSNTVPAIVEAFCGVGVPAIEDSDYSRLYALTISTGRKARLLRLVAP